MRRFFGRAALAPGLVVALMSSGACLGDAELDSRAGGGPALGQAAASVTGPVMGDARCNDRVRLRSWKGDYLHRPDTPNGVTSFDVPDAIGNSWTVECLADGNIQLRSWKGDYLHRPDTPQGVTTWGFGAWTVVPGVGGGFMLRSWKGDYLHRPNNVQGVTTWDQGTWKAEVLVMGGAACNDRVRLTSWKGDYLDRPKTTTEPLVSSGGTTRDLTNVWGVECLANGNIQLRSWYGDYLHRPNTPQGVTTWSFGEWTVVSGDFNTFMLRSWKGDYLHRPNTPEGVTTWTAGTWTAAVVPDTAAVVARFAPRLRFDGAGKGYPMSAQTYFDQRVVNPPPYEVPFFPPLENEDVATLGLGTIPTYYQVIECGTQVRIKYWWFYGVQHTCDGVFGGHHGDWENAVVTLSQDRRSVAAVSFSMHGGSYTRLAARGGFELEDGTHPVIYVAKTSHASLFEQGGSSTSCLPWEEYRNNTDGSHLDSWTNLVDLNGNAEPWLTADRQGGFSWGYDGVDTHPTTDPATCAMNAASWSLLNPTWWHSQCKYGDRDAGWRCFGRCRPGYDEVGGYCIKSITDVYAQYTYDYDYNVPTSDLGLLIYDYY